MPSGNHDPTAGSLALLDQVCREFPTLGGEVERLRGALLEGERLGARPLHPALNGDQRVLSKMGLTIVHKGKPGPRKKNPKVALVLAGGAVTGGAFKLGALKASTTFSSIARPPTSMSTSVSARAPF